MSRRKIHEDRQAYKQAFNKATYYRLYLLINKKETAIINKLESQENKTDYIKKLIMADIKKGG